MPVFARTLASAAPLLLAIALCAHVARDARAAGTQFKVERAEGAERCPDADELQQLVDAVREPGPVAPTRPSYRVSFAREKEAFVATIYDPSGSSRALRDRSAECEALGRATAVTLALLLDAQPPAPEPAKPALPKPALPKTKPQAPHNPIVNPVPARAREPYGLGVHASAVVLAGVVEPFAPALEAGLGVRVYAWRASLGLLGLAKNEVALGPGSVATQLRGGLFEGCFAPRVKSPRLELCSGLLLGAVSARARGYSSDRTAWQPWLAVPLALTVSVATEPVGWQAGGALLLPLPPQQFRVEGVGTAYEAPPLGGMFWLRVSFEMPW